MTLEQRRLWELIRISPIKWQQDPYGTLGGGFWVVAIYGSKVIWFNDIEEGFNRSRWMTMGVLSEYGCNQDELQWTVQHVLDDLKEGQEFGERPCLPEPVQ